MNKRLRVGLVIFSAVVISTLGIQASDLLQGVSGSLTGSVLESDGPCNEGEVLAVVSSQTLCVDVYEASPNSVCPVATVVSAVQTNENFFDTSCKAVSAAGVQPWRFVSFTQAQQLCARSGKRLLNNREWYQLVSGLNIESCVIDEPAAQPTGSKACQSPFGLYDQVGNVWEWVDAEVIDGVYKNRLLPTDGYVVAVDAEGVVASTSAVSQIEYGEDYVWTNSTGLRGMIRGGFYGSKSDAGIFALNAAVELSAQSTGVGFRCVRDVY